MAVLATSILRGLTSTEHLDEIESRESEVPDLNYCDPLGRRLIHIAADIGDTSALRWLVSRGADPRAMTSREGNTALHVAASEGHREAVRYLLEEVSMGVAGLNLAGETALDVAVTAGHDRIVADLTRHLRSLITPPKDQHYHQRRKDEESAMIHDPHRNDSEGSRQDAVITTPTPPATTSQVHSIPSAKPEGSAGGLGRTSLLSSATKKEGRPVPFDGRGATKEGFFVNGAWSKAGVCSCFNVRHRDLLGKHGIVFDMGVCPPEVVPVQHVFITHGHLDHSGAVVSHARMRGMSKGSTGKYYMHAALAAGMEKVKRAFEEIDGASIAMDIVPVSPDDNIDLGQGCFVRPFLVQHRVEALGFALMRRRSGGLKPEYQGIDGKALGALKKRGVDITLSHETVEVVYTGDTVMSPLVSTPLVWKARLLIMEVSYLAGDGTAAAKHQHIHIQDVLDNAEKFRGVEQLLVAHVSDRYGGHRKVLRLLAEALPSFLLNKVSVALGEFGAPAHLTFLEDYISGEARGTEGDSVKDGGGGVAGQGGGENGV